MSELLITVRREPQDYRNATYRLDDLKEPHWSDHCNNTEGRFRGRFNDDYICGYVQCDGALEGGVAHTGNHGPCPHRIKVCVIKKYTDKAAYKALLEIVGEKPQKPPRKKKKL